MKNTKIKILVFVIVAIIMLDQISKFVLSNVLKDGNTIGNYDTICLTEVYNTGMAFGFNDGNTKNIVVTFIVLLLIGTFVKNQFEQIDNKTMFAVAITTAGGLSNLIDRFIRHSVFDFIKIYKFPVFNIADICVVAGWMLLILFLIIYSRKK